MEAGAGAEAGAEAGAKLWAGAATTHDGPAVSQPAAADDAGAAPPEERDGPHVAEAALFPRKDGSTEAEMST